MNDLIRRQDAIDVVEGGAELIRRVLDNMDVVIGERGKFAYGLGLLESCIEELSELPSAQPEARWNLVKTRPMTEEERQEYSEYFGYDIEYEDAVMFECKMPDDGQNVWVCSKCGNVWQDTCVVEEGIGLEGNGDWLDIVAWMPFEKPEPWRGEQDEV